MYVKVYLSYVVCLKFMQFSFVYEYLINFLHHVYNLLFKSLFDLFPHFFSVNNFLAISSLQLKNEFE